MEILPVPPCSSLKESWGRQTEPHPGGELCLQGMRPLERGAGASLPPPPRGLDVRSGELRGCSHAAAQRGGVPLVERDQQAG